MTEIINLNCSVDDLKNIKNKELSNSKHPDLIDYSNVIIKKPWGYEYIIYQTSNLAITILFINKGHNFNALSH